MQWTLNLLSRFGKQSSYCVVSFHSFRQGRKSKEGWYLSRFPTIKFDVTQWRSFWVVLPFYTFWVRYVWVNTLSVKLHRAQLWNVIINLTRGDIEVDRQLRSKTKSFLFRVVVWSRRTGNPIRKFSLKHFHLFHWYCCDILVVKFVFPQMQNSIETTFHCFFRQMAVGKVDIKS